MDVRNVPISVAFQLFYTGEKGRVSNIGITQEALCKSHLFLGKKLSMASPKLSIENIYGSTRWLLDRLLLGISLLICQQVQCTTKSSASCCAMDGKSIAVLHPHNCWHFSSQKMGAGELREVWNPVHWFSSVSTRWGCCSIFSGNSWLHPHDRK